MAAAAITAIACAAPAANATSPSSTASATSATHGQHGGNRHHASALPHFDHVVIVMDENHEQGQIIGSPDAPYINSLAKGGANFTQSYAITHPSQPNYLALFSGSTQGVTSDACPQSFSADNLGNQLRTANLSFTGYSEDIPSAGSSTCTSGDYARKHVPWSNFTDLPQSEVSLPYTSFPSDSTGYAKLPTVSWVVPNLQDDMHDGTVAQGDTWLKNNIDGYAQWAKANNSLLIVTFDEDDSAGANQIPTLFYGAHVAAGDDSTKINHYTVLRTLEDMYGLPALGSAAGETAIGDCWD
ncbi:MAG: acid phosphatase [Sciscionella sp.]|nr:acid phosphatase [Sciscionella sp.]